jgi:hypothetical protein
VSDKTAWKDRGQSCGTPIGPDGTVSRVLGPAKENNMRWNPRKGI